MPAFALKTHRLTIERLKGIRMLDEISFEDKPLTGIFGPNGVGKSTVLHALASAYGSPKGTTSDYKQFFPPMMADIWNGTRFVIEHSYQAGKSTAQGMVEYRKGTVHTSWTPSLADRPLRHLSYMGVKSCLPDLEAYESHDLSTAVSKPRTEQIDATVREAAGRILNCNYTVIAKLEIPGDPEKDYIALTRQDIANEYPSVVMGAGEQRIFRLLYKLEESPENGLMLVDELDLLLHGDALKRLVNHLDDRCRKKRMQLVFTSHREELLSLKDKINIRHVWTQGGKHYCFANTDPDSLHRLTGNRERRLEIFVEDDLAVGVVSHIAGEMGMSRYVKIIPFGAAKNCFTVFAGLLIKGETCEDSLFILDGDEYETPAKKQEQINVACSGQDAQAIARRHEIVKRTLDFVLPAGIKPEPFIHGLIIAQNPDAMSTPEKEIHQVAVGIVNPEDKHDFVDKIVETLGDNRDAQLARLIPLAAKMDGEWKVYTQPVRDWLAARKAALNLP